MEKNRSVENLNDENSRSDDLANFNVKQEQGRKNEKFVEVGSL